MIAEINGLKINYYDSGVRNEKPPIIFIHGFPFSSEMWAPQVERLKESYRVLTYDIRGHGKSDAGDGQYTLEFFVDDLMALLDSIGVPRATLCGLSMGGYIALRAVERNPERVYSLILCDTGPQADTNEVKLRRAASIRLVKTKGVDQYAESFVKAVFTTESFKSRQNEVEMIKRVIRSNSEIGICGTLLALAGRTDTTEALQFITVPTLILVGDSDKITPPKLSQIMDSKIKNSQFHIIPNAAHLSNLENPMEFNRFLFDFLK